MIAGRIPGRTDNEIKNYWNTHLSKKLINQGIDPRTHKPLDNINNPSSSSSIIPNINHQTTAFTSSASPDHHPITTTTNNESDHNPSLAQYHSHNNHYPQQEQQHQQAQEFNGANCDSLISDVSAIDHQLLDNNIRDYDDSCCDDVFTSFLDSLINEDAYATHRSENDPLILSAAPPSLWESPLINMSTIISTKNNNDSPKTGKIHDA